MLTWVRFESYDYVGVTCVRETRRENYVKLTQALDGQSFADVWSGSKAKKQRDWVHACAGCWAECEVLPSAIYSGDLLRALV